MPLNHGLLCVLLHTPTSLTSFLYVARLIEVIFQYLGSREARKSHFFVLRPQAHGKRGLLLEHAAWSHLVFDSQFISVALIYSSLETLGRRGAHQARIEICWVTYNNAKISLLVPSTHHHDIYQILLHLPAYRTPNLLISTYFVSPHLHLEDGHGRWTATDNDLYVLTVVCRKIRGHMQML